MYVPLNAVLCMHENQWVMSVETDPLFWPLPPPREAGSATGRRWRSGKRTIAAGTQVVRDEDRAVVTVHTTEERGDGTHT